MHMNMSATLCNEHESIWYDELCVCLVSKCVYVKGLLM